MNKKQIIPIITVAVIIAVGSYFYFQDREEKQLAQEQQKQNTDTLQEQTTNNTTTKNQVNSTPLPAKKLPYAEAIEKYPNRIQFKNCSGIPGKISIKKGLLIMLDNRDAQAHTIAIKSQSVRIPAYDYALLPATVLGTYNITCDGGGAAEINVEV